MSSKRLVSGLHLGKQGLHKLLGPLEAQIMNELWQRGEGTVSEVWRSLAPDRNIAYDTVRTVMNRLVIKGLLERETAGKAHLYRPTLPQSEFTERTIGTVLDELLSDFGEPAIAQFLDRLSCEDEERILALSRLIEERRQGRTEQG